MHPDRFDKQLYRPDPVYPHDSLSSVWDRLQQPSVLVPAVILLSTIAYQSLHSSPFFSFRYLVQLLWDSLVAIIPSRLLFAIDGWLRPPMFPVSKPLTPASALSTHTAKSEALRRILGIDKAGSIMSSVAQVGRKSFSSLSGRTLVKGNADKPPGLGNYDNSCFQNSILQGLSSLKPLPAYLETAAESKSTENTDDSGSASTLLDLIAKLTNPTNNGTTFWTPQKLKSLDTWQQQDAQEYFSKILDEVDKEVALAVRAHHKQAGLESISIRDDTEASQYSEDSGYQSLSTSSKSGIDYKPAKNPLEGLMAQRVACVQCGHSEGLSMIPFNCLTLSLGVGQTGHDLYERLDAYTDLETIQGVECAKCTLLKLQRLLRKIVDADREKGSAEETLRPALNRLDVVEAALEEDDFDEKTLAEKCKITKQSHVSSVKTKQMVIARPPQSLAIHINRSVFDEQTGNMFKNLAAVQFPSTLDLGPWCLGSGGGPEVVVGTESHYNSGSDPSDEEECWLSDPRSSMVAGDLKPSRISGPIYQLRAVITHQGRHENGHYVCYRRHPFNDTKHEETFDEEPTTPIDEDDINPFHDEEATSAGGTVSRGKDERVSEHRWWRLSDENVWEVPEETVLAQGGVFMLFYDCVDPNSVFVSRELIDRALGNAGIKLGEITTQGSARSKTTVFSDTTVPESEEQFHDAISGISSAERANSRRCPDGLAPCEDSPERKLAISEGQGSQATHPSRPIANLHPLLPLLRDDEQIDPSIPLRRPNR